MTQLLEGNWRRVEPTNSYLEFTRAEIEQSIPARFEKQVEQQGARPAIRTAQHQLSYDELNQLANQLAHSIIQRSSVSKVPVALLMEHDAPLIAAMLGVLKAGRFYVVLDPAQPLARLRQIIEDAGPDLVITDTKNAARATEVAPMGSSSFDDLIRDQSVANPEVAVRPAALAYLIYTSGSTGKPKGVCHTHRSALHHIRRYTNSCHLSAEDRFSLVTSCAVGASVSNICGALLNGGLLLPFDLKEEGIARLYDWLQQEGITIYHSVPIVFRHLCEMVGGERSFPQLRLIKLGGEAITRHDFELYKRSFAEHALLYVGLGSTEMHSICYWLLDRRSEFSGPVIPVGHAVEDTEILLLNESGNEVSHGETGEIAIRSNYLFSGYWQKGEVSNSGLLSDASGTPIFRTQDLGRMLPDGLLQHLGRNQYRVKVRGARVEVAEVELALRAQPEVTDCVVLAKRCGDDNELVGYLTNGSGTRLEPATLRSRLAARLPDYMIPASFVWLDQLPRTNGKVDRAQLSALPTRYARASYVAPRNQLEAALVEIWQNVLGQEQIGIHDNFFELGGHSLAASRVVVAIDRRLARQLPESTLFWAPTVEALAHHLSSDTSAAPARSLVELKAAGSELPLFIIHGWGGDVHFYGELANLLPEQPVYGLQAIGLDGRGPRHFRVEEMAAHYLKEIRITQAHGPYHFLGYSLGSLIAFEVARQAYLVGEEVEFLGLMDPPGRPAPWLAYIRTIAPLLAHSARFHLTRWVRSGESFHFKRRVKRLRRWIKRNKPRARAVHTAPETSITPPAIPGFKDYYAAVTFPYQLQYYPGTIDLIIGDSVSGALLPLWQHLAKGGARYHRLSCTHKEMIQREFLPTLAATLRKALAMARNKPTASG